MGAGAVFTGGSQRLEVRDKRSLHSVGFSAETSNRAGSQTLSIDNTESQLQKTGHENRKLQYEAKARAHSYESLPTSKNSQRAMYLSNTRTISS